MKNEIKIYVACLAAYNNGHLHGIWIDATAGVDDIHAQVAAMLAGSPVSGAEEYAIHAYEGFGGYTVGEYEGFEAVHDIAAFIAEHSEFGGALLEHLGDLESAQKAVEDSYCGCHASLADYAQELTEETTEIPNILRNYIDYEAMGRDMELGGDVFSLETGFREVHIFWNH